VAGILETELDCLIAGEERGEKKIPGDFFYIRAISRAKELTNGMRIVLRDTVSRDAVRIKVRADSAEGSIVGRVVEVDG
jgi:hypothetical protein